MWKNGQVLFAPDAGAGTGGGTGGTGGTGGAPAAAANPLAAAAAGVTNGTPAAAGANGQAAAANGAAGANGQQPPNGQAAGANGAPGIYYPEGLPDEFRGTTERETLDRLAKEVTGRPKPPGKAEDYKLDLPPALQSRFGDLKDDKVLPLWQKVAHKAGLTNDQYQSAFADLYTEMSNAGILEPPMDIEAELMKLAPQSGDATQKKAAAAARVNTAVNWAKGLSDRGTLSTKEATLIGSIAASADGVAAIEKIMRLTGEHGVQVGGGNPALGQTMQSVKSQMADPRYDTRNPKYDADFRTRVDADFRRLHGAG